MALIFHEYLFEDQARDNTKIVNLYNQREELSFSFNIECILYILSGPLKENRMDLAQSYFFQALLN